MSRISTEGVRGLTHQDYEFFSIKGLGGSLALGVHMRIGGVNENLVSTTTSEANSQGY